MSGDDGTTLFGSLVRSGGIVFLGLVVEVGLSFLAKVVMARVLGPAGFGTVSLGITTFTVASYLVMLGLDTGVSRFLPRDDDVSFRRGVVVSAMQVAVPLSLVCGGVLAALAPTIAVTVFHDPSTAPTLRVFGLVVPLAVFVRLALGGIRGAKKSLPKVYLKNVLLPTARFAAIGLVLFAGWNAVGVAWAYAVAYAAAGALGLYYLHKHTPLFAAVDHDGRHRELLAFSAPLVVSAAMALVFDKLDTLMLGYFWPTAEVGVYNVVYPVAWALLVTLNAFRYLFMPAVSELHARGAYDEMRQAYQLTTKWVFLSTLPPFLALVLYPRFALATAFGPDYAEGALALVILAGAFVTHAVAGPNREVLTSMGRTRLIMYDNAAVAGVNVVLNLLLIPTYSYVGAAVATACSYVLLNLLYTHQLYRETGIQPLTAAQLRPGAVAIAGVVGLHWLLTETLGPGLRALVALAALSAVGYPLAIARFSSFERAEVATARRVRERLSVVARVVQLFGR